MHCLAKRVGPPPGYTASGIELHRIDTRWVDNQNGSFVNEMYGHLDKENNIMYPILAVGKNCLGQRTYTLCCGDKHGYLCKNVRDEGGVAIPRSRTNILHVLVFMTRFGEIPESNNETEPEVCFLKRAFNALFHGNSGNLAFDLT